MIREDLGDLEELLRDRRPPGLRACDHIEIGHPTVDELPAAMPASLTLEALAGLPCRSGPILRAILAGTRLTLDAPPGRLSHPNRRGARPRHAHPLIVDTRDRRALGHPQPVPGGDG